MLALPLIVPGVAGAEFTVTARVCTEDEPQVLFALTVMFPLPEPAVVLMLVVVDVPAHPEGNVQVYDVALFTAEIVYVLAVPEHIDEFPVIIPGCDGIGFTVTLNSCGCEEPHVLFATTVISPLTEPAAALMELVTELPVQPDGIVHV